MVSKILVCPKSTLQYYVSGHEVESLPHQLEGDYNRQMGSGYTVRGFQTPFTSQQDQRDWPNPPISFTEQSLLIQEVNTLLEKGAIIQIDDSQ